MIARAGTVHAALLRGINVSGKNKLPMNALREIFEDAGCRDVETYIQSGNVVFAAAARLARRVPRMIRQMIRESFGYDVPVIVRSTGELESIARENPFVMEGADPQTLHVAFLANEPASTQIARLDPHRSPPDRFAVLGAEIYLCCPKGIGRSKLTTAYFDSKLETTTTIRNWRTVTKLLEMVTARNGSPCR